jgi:thiosulfate reductase/polysulfide reductase chain A
MGLDPMPVYTAPAKVPNNQFRLVVGRNAYFTHGSTQNNALLHELMPENTLWLHPDAAKALGIADGELVEVASSVGRGELKASLTKGIRTDTVYMLTGFGAISPGLTRIHNVGASISALLDDKVDAISGNAALHTTFVTVTRKVAS